MIITKSEPFTPEEIEKLCEEYEGYIKTVIDIETKVCAAGMRIHLDGEQIILQKGSRQSDVWGGGIDINSREIDYNSFINIRPTDGNTTNTITIESIRKRFEELTRFYFKSLYEQ